jgi:hypothetical protein
MNMGVCSDEISWMDEHYYLPHEVNRNYEKDSFFEKETIWISGEYMLKMCKIRKDKMIFEEMMGESADIRRNVVTANKSQGWGNSKRKVQKNPLNKKKDRPYRPFADGDWHYNGKPITNDEAKAIFKNLNSNQP